MIRKLPHYLLLLAAALAIVFTSTAHGQSRPALREYRTLDEIQLLADETDALADELKLLARALGEEPGDSETLADSQGRLVNLLEQAHDKFGRLRVIIDVASGQSDLFRTNLFGRLRLQAQDVSQGQRMAEIARRAAEALDQLWLQLDEIAAEHRALVDAGEAESDARQARLISAKENLDRIHAELVENPEAWMHNLDWLDMKSAARAVDYSRIVLWGVLILASIGLLFLLVRFLRNRYGNRVQPSQSLATIGGETVRLDMPDEHRRQALEALENVQLRLALHHFHLMALSALDQARLVALDRARTNWELHDQLLRRKRASEAAVLADMNRTYDRKWYGGESLSRDEVDKFSNLADNLRQEVQNENS